MSEEFPDKLQELGIEGPTFEQNAAMRFGLAFEDAICDFVGRQGGCEITEREQIYTHGSLEYVTAHIDGRLSDSVIIENKTTNIRSFRDSWGEPGTDHIPEDYMIQVQHQMACTGAKHCIVTVVVFPRMPDEWEADGISISENGFFVWNVSQPESYVKPKHWLAFLYQAGFVHRYAIYRNEDLITKMLEGYSDFWHNHVLTGQPPKAEKYGDIKKLLTPPVGTVVASEEIERICAIDKALAKEIKEAEAKREKYKTMIGQHMKDNLEGASIDDDSREKIVLRDRQGRKLRSFSKKGGLR
jgi:predicted phage-related endonuclease